MEGTNIHQRGAENPALTGREAIREESRRQQNGLSSLALNTGSNRMIHLANDEPGYLQATVNINAGKFATHLNAVANRMYKRLHTGTPEAPSWSTRVDRAFADQDVAAARLHEIADKMENEDVPDFEEGEKLVTPYIKQTRAEKIHGPNRASIPQYHLRTVILHDIDTLKKFYNERHTPEQRMVIRELIDALSELARQDMGRMIHQALTGTPQYTTMAMNKMGKIIGVFGLVGAGLGLGLTSMLQGQVPVAGIVSLGAAICLSSENVRRRIFDAKNEAMFRENEATFKEMDELVKEKLLKTAETYKMKGPIWAQVTQKMMRPTERTRLFCQKWEGRLATEAEKTAFAEEMIPSLKHRSEHENLLKILNSPDKKAFQYIIDLKKMKQKDAQVATAGMIDLGVGECRVKALALETVLPPLAEDTEGEQTA